MALKKIAIPSTKTIILPSSRQRNFYILYCEGGSVRVSIDRDTLFTKPHSSRKTQLVVDELSTDTGLPILDGGFMKLSGEVARGVVSAIATAGTPILQVIESRHEDLGFEYTPSLASIGDVTVSPPPAPVTPVISTNTLKVIDGVIDASSAAKTLTIPEGAISIHAYITNNDSENNYALEWSDSNDSEKFHSGDRIVRMTQGVIGTEVLVYPQTVIKFPVGAKGTYAVSALSTYGNITIA